MAKTVGSKGMRAHRAASSVFHSALSTQHLWPKVGYGEAGYGRRPVSPWGIPGIPRAAFAIFILCMTMALSSCGFQLRGQAAIPYKTLLIETTGYSLFANDLERAIRSGSQTKIVQSRDAAEAVLKIVGEVQEKHILSLSSAGRVREFELRYRVTYRLIDSAGTDLTPPGQINLRRDMTYDDTEVLAKESEELLLFRDMKADAVQQMLRRLSVAKPAA